MAERDRGALRLLRRVAAGTGRPPEADAAAVAQLLRDGLIERDGERLIPTRLGLSALRRHLAGADGFAVQHQVRARVGIDDPLLGRVSVTRNEDESPLTRLRRARSRNGEPLIGTAEFEAGERLRRDFTTGRMMPRVTSNWSIAGGRRGRGDAGGMAEMNEAIVAARQRVDRALRGVGPDFAGLLIDVCCFLKGIEEIERERAWPARSAKLVLRLALVALARHYGLGGSAEGAPVRRLVHWGSDDYRPQSAPGVTTSDADSGPDRTQN
ncbi:MAG: hypothetical protein KDK07_19580 [Bauldia sp.]|nr:hypothetical protein [Bauldia sp.]